MTLSLAMKNTILSFTLLIFACSVDVFGQSATNTLPQEASPAINVGHHKQLFIDSKFIDQSSGVKLTVNPPRKIEPVIFTDKPWDVGRIIYSSIVRDEEGTYRLYYFASAAGKNRKMGAASLCLATSKDGITWEKPDLGLVKKHGSTHNNIVKGTPPGHVFIDPKAPADQRYKIVPGGRYFNSREKGGLWIGYSADGLTWQYPETRQLPYACDTHNIVFFDPYLKKYAAYLRAWHPTKQRVVTRTEVETDNILGTWPVKPITEESHFVWGKDHPPTLRDEFPIALELDEKDTPMSDIYTPAVELYPWAPRIYLSFFSVYRHDNRKHSNDGVLDVQLAVSRDGKTFTRPERKTYIPTGIHGQDGDWGGIYYITGMIRNGKYIYQYYTGMNVTHHGHMSMDDVRHLSSVYRVEQRLDGFVSADFDYSGGSLLTPPLKFNGNQLLLNLNCSASGIGKVEIRDADNKPIPGYTLKDCDPIGLNQVDMPVTFRGKTDLSKIAQPVRLFFEFRNAKLYAFQFLTPKAPTND